MGSRYFEREFFDRLLDHLRGPIKNKQGRGVRHGTHKSLVVGAVGVIPYVDKKGDAREKAGRLRLAASFKMPMKKLSAAF